MTGAVTSSDVAISQGRKGATYTPKIFYSYQIAGRSYSGSSVTPGRIWSSSAAYAAVRDFPAGSRPAVYYNSAAPGQAVLIPGLHFYNFAWFIFGLIPLTLAGTIGSLGILTRVYGIPPNADGSYTLPNNNMPGTLIFLFGFVGFVVEIGLAVWAGHQ